jgi:hypothetical protein
MACAGTVSHYFSHIWLEGLSKNTKISRVFVVLVGFEQGPPEHEAVVVSTAPYRLMIN